MKLQVDVTLTAVELADAFCEMGDEQQAQFFIEVARIADGWPPGIMPRGWQWREVGKHLRNCSCSSESARALVREIADGMAERPAFTGRAA
jgi:hypothetical protein